MQGITRNGTLHYVGAAGLRSNIYTAELGAVGKASKSPVLATDRFLNSNSAPAWSPDGRALAYLSSRGRGQDTIGSTVLVIRTVATGEERNISLPKEVQTGNLVPAPRWFPDGQSILVFGYLPKGRGIFYRIGLANGKAEVIHEANGVSGNAGLGASVISADGKAILYIASPSDPFTGTTNLVRFELDNGRETILKSGTSAAPRHRRLNPGAAALTSVPSPRT